MTAQHRIRALDPTPRRARLTMWYQLNGNRVDPVYMSKTCIPSQVVYYRIYITNTLASAQVVLYIKNLSERLLLEKAETSETHGHCLGLLQKTGGEIKKYIIIMKKL